jgi:hypothetical protein
MFGQRLADPHVLAVFGTNKQYEIIARGIVGVEEVRDYTQQAEAARQEDELIFFAQLIEDVLLKFL